MEIKMGKKGNGLTKLENDYILKYSMLPDTQEELLAYLRSHLKIKMSLVEEQIKYIESLKWKEIGFALPIEPKASPRPRYNSFMHNFYVKGAKDYKKIARRVIPPEAMKQVLDDYGIICTRTEFTITTFQPTPNMRNHEVYLAEMGYIRPLQNPD
jgi:hypothetical protein